MYLFNSLVFCSDVFYLFRGLPYRPRACQLTIGWNSERPPSTPELSAMRNAHPIWFSWLLVTYIMQDLWKYKDPSVKLIMWAIRSGSHAVWPLASAHVLFTDTSWVKVVFISLQFRSIYFVCYRVSCAGFFFFTHSTCACEYSSLSLIRTRTHFFTTKKPPQAVTLATSTG